MPQKQARNSIRSSKTCRKATAIIYQKILMAFNKQNIHVPRKLFHCWNGWRVIDNVVMKVDFQISHSNLALHFCGTP